MSAGKYVIPIVMGEASREVFRIEGDMVKTDAVFLLRHLKTRSVLPKDERPLSKLMEMNRRSEMPSRIMELEVISDTNKLSIDPHHAALIHGYITNVLPGAFKAPELNDWFILEKPSELTTLKMARFAINLLSTETRARLLSLLQVRANSAAMKYAQYR